MRPFRYERPDDAAGAVALLADDPGARFLGGGTNLVDLMRLGVETPGLLVDVRRLASDQIEETDGRRAAHRQRRPQQRSLRAPARARALRRCSPRRSSRARRGSSATAPRRAATCCSARAATTSRTSPSRATSASPAPAARRSRASTATWRSSAGRSTASRPTRPTWPSRSPRSTPSSTSRVATARRAIPIDEFYRLPGTTPERDTVLEHGELITAIELPPPVSQTRPLREGARARVVRVRGGIAGSAGRGRGRARCATSGSCSAASPIAPGGRGWRRMRCAAPPRRPRRSREPPMLELAEARPLRDNAYKVPLARNVLVSTLGDLAWQARDGDRHLSARRRPRPHRGPRQGHRRRRATPTSTSRADARPPTAPWCSRRSPAARSSRSTPPRRWRSRACWRCSRTRTPSACTSPDGELAVLQDDRIAYRGQIVAAVVADSLETSVRAASLVRIDRAAGVARLRARRRPPAALQAGEGEPELRDRHGARRRRRRAGRGRGRCRCDVRDAGVPQQPDGAARDRRDVGCRRRSDAVRRDAGVVRHARQAGRAVRPRAGAGARDREPRRRRLRLQGHAPAARRDRGDGRAGSSAAPSRSRPPASRCSRSPATARRRSSASSSAPAATATSRRSRTTWSSRHRPSTSSPSRRPSPTRMMYAAATRRTTHRLVALDVPTPSWMRAPGETPGMFALETAMDELAVACGLDPIELRARNEPAIDPDTGHRFSSRNLVGCLREGARAVRLGRPRPAARHPARRRVADRHRRRVRHLSGAPQRVAGDRAPRGGRHVHRARRSDRHRHRRAHGR